MEVMAMQRITRSDMGFAPTRSRRVEDLHNLHRIREAEGQLERTQDILRFLGRVSYGMENVRRTLLRQREQGGRPFPDQQQDVQQDAAAAIPPPSPPRAAP
jgi:hypothetical protein